jgi:fructose/tagatose bisphosphate aldolase
MKSQNAYFEIKHAMRTLHEVLQAAERQKVAVGHFNVSDLITLKAAVEAARELNVPDGERRKE